MDQFQDEQDEDQAATYGDHITHEERVDIRDQILAALRTAGRPIWLADLSRMLGIQPNRLARVCALYSMTIPTRPRHRRSLRRNQSSMQHVVTIHPHLADREPGFNQTLPGNER